MEGDKGLYGQKKPKQKHLTEAVTQRIISFRIEMNKYWINRKPIFICETDYVTNLF